MADDKKIVAKIEGLLSKGSIKKEALERIGEVIEEKKIIREMAGEEALVKPEKPDENAGVVAHGNLPVDATSKLKLRQKQVEKVLESDLEKIYSELSSDKKREFKIAGEQTAIKINLLLEKTKVKIKDIINLIKKWLLIIPGINKYFLEQEAKIKADKIIKMKNIR